jgi:hypothetical protein
MAQMHEFPKADVDVERCAEALAAVRQFPKGEREAVLARYGWDEQHFSAALAAIGSGGVGGLSREDPRVLLRFAGAYGAADRYIRQERPRAKDLRPMIARPVPPPAPQPSPPAAAPVDIESTNVGLGAPPRGSTAPAGPAPGPKLRYVKYDPQTGRLLATPRWEEEET